MVVMDRKDYIDKANNLLSQPSYRAIERVPPKTQGKTHYFSHELKKGNRTGGPHLQVHVSSGMYLPKVLWSTKY